MKVLMANFFICFIISLFFISSFASAQSAIKSSSLNSNTSALSRARALQAPQPKLSYQGEYENNEWWLEHFDLFQEARKEWGRKHQELYRWDDNMKQFLDPDLYRAFSNRDEHLLASLIDSTGAPFVFTFRLFTKNFTEQLLDEIKHHKDSGVPLRRPNGMNRYGAILSELGFDNMINGLVSELLVPIARHIFPAFVGPSELSENYPFVVCYHPDRDASLSEHTDASTVTVNVCLQASDDRNVLYFKENRFWKRSVHHTEQRHARHIGLSEPGRAVIHLGQHVHGVSQIDSPRSNLVVWMFGEHGYVRIAPYGPKEVERHKREYSRFWKQAKVPVLIVTPKRLLLQPLQGCY